MNTETTVRQAIEAYDRQDLDQVAAMLAEDLCYTINARAETGPYIADCHSKSEFFDAVGKILDDWEIGSYKIADLVVSGDRAAAQINILMISRHTGKSIESRLALFMQTRDGKLTRIDEYHDTIAAGSSRAA